MAIFVKFNSKEKEQIVNFEKRKFLIIQESLIQKNLQLDEFINLFKNPKIIKIKANDINSKTIINITNEMLEISFLNPVKIFTIQDIEDLKTSEQKAFLELLKDVPEGNIFILTSNKEDKNSPIYKDFKKENLIINNLILTDKEITDFINKRLKEANLESSKKDIASLIFTQTKKNLDKINDQIDILEVYAQNGIISSKEYLNLFPIKEDENDFYLLDMIYKENYIEYTKTLKNILDNKNEFLLLSIFKKAFSNLFLIKELVNKKNTIREIENKTSLKDWVIKKNIDITKKYTSTQLRNNLRRILESEVKLKDTNLGKFFVFEKLYFYLKPKAIRK